MGNGALLGLHKEEPCENFSDGWASCDCDESPDWASCDCDETDESPEESPEKQSIGAAQEKIKIAKAIHIKGAVGKFSSGINSTFVDTGKMCNGRMLYQSWLSPDNWLRYTDDGRWMVSNTKDKDDNLSGGFCYCKTSGLLDPSCAETGWYVLGEQGVFRMQPMVEALKITSADDVKQFAKTPMAIKVQGATGLLAYKINGTYKCQNDPSQCHEAPKLFRRCEAQPASKCTTLAHDSLGRWVVTQGYMLGYCELKDLTDPCDAKRWHVVNFAGSFSLQPSMSVARVSCKQTELPLFENLPLFEKRALSQKQLMFETRVRRTRGYASIASSKKKVKERRAYSPAKEMLSAEMVSQFAMPRSTKTKQNKGLSRSFSSPNRAPNLVKHLARNRINRSKSAKRIRKKRIYQSTSAKRIEKKSLYRLALERNQKYRSQKQYLRPLGEESIMTRK